MLALVCYDGTNYTDWTYTETQLGFLGVFPWNAAYIEYTIDGSYSLTDTVGAKTYDNFTYPVAVLTVNGKKFSDNKNGFVLSDIEVELTSGYEASMVSFMIYNTFDQPTSQFRTEEVKKYIFLGNN